MKYIIFDFGGVLAYPTTGNWHLTPKLLELIDIAKLDKEKAISNIKLYQNIIDCSLKIETIKDEYNAMVEFYDNVFKDSYSEYSKQLVEQIAKDRVFGFDKYRLYSDVISELERLSKKNKLILLSDNWPSVLEYMRHFGLDTFFDRIYVSSIYGVKKQDGDFFDVMLKDYDDINESNAIFIDDHEENLDVAKEKGITGILMDRDYKNNNSKYKIINSLNEILRKGLSL